LARKITIFSFHNKAGCPLLLLYDWNVRVLPPKSYKFTIFISEGGSNMMDAELPLGQPLQGDTTNGEIEGHNLFPPLTQVTEKLVGNLLSLRALPPDPNPQSTRNDAANLNETIVPSTSRVPTVDRPTASIHGTKMTPSSTANPPLPLQKPLYQIKRSQHQTYYSICP
jgi:hypothetical protein